MKFNKLTEKEKATIGVYRNSKFSCYLCNKLQACGEETESGFQYFLEFDFFEQEKQEEKKESEESAEFCDECDSEYSEWELKEE